ncbi:MAG: 6-pyruvoyl trahydropterin synthase family protein [Bacteroidota bacterium]
MLSITKIFNFEMAHAINGYEGACRHIHGHSYQLYVSVSFAKDGPEFISSPGFIIDFKVLKQIVESAVVGVLDHKLVLSKDYLSNKPYVELLENLIVWEFEPTVENILLYIKDAIRSELPVDLRLTALKLYETKDSYSEWKY